MIKVLIIHTAGVKYDGITSVIFNYSRAMNRSELDLELCVYEDTEPELKAAFEKLGTLQTVHNRKKNPKIYLKDLDALMASGYDIVHVHGNSGTMFLDASVARRHRIKRIVLHNHNTTCDHKVLNLLLKGPMKACATDLIACSEAAGKWLYGSSDFTVLNNAIDIRKFRYSETLRKHYRDEFGIRDEFVIGHSGTFNEQKNHLFLIDVFNEYHKIDSNAKLLLLSDGSEFEAVQAKVKDLGLDDNVIFAGRRGDANQIYSAMDLFILPSLWEGLPLVMIEAQANGLPVLASDVVTRDAKCTDRAFYYGLNGSALAWAEKIQEVRSFEYIRGEDMSFQIRQKGFDINCEADKLRNIYLAAEFEGGYYSVIFFSTTYLLLNASMMGVHSQPIPGCLKTPDWNGRLNLAA